MGPEIPKHLIDKGPTKAEKDDYGRKRLQARMAGNIAPAVLECMSRHGDTEFNLDVADTKVQKQVAKISLSIANYIIDEVGL